MIYPKNFESKIGFDEVRAIMKSHCLSTMGKETVDNMTPSDQAKEVNERLTQTREFRLLMEQHDRLHQ